MRKMNVLFALCEILATQRLHVIKARLPAIFTHFVCKTHKERQQCVPYANVFISSSSELCHGTYTHSIYTTVYLLND